MQQPADPVLPDLSRIRRYYDETWMDYRAIWLNQDNAAIHFGYWDEDTRSHAQSLLNMNRVLARRMGLRPGQRILDAGCGVGGSAIWLCKEFSADVLGITPVASQIVRARRFARQQGVQVSFEQQDYTHVAVPDASFDAVWAIESVCHAPDKRLFLAEARRVLRPGGRLGIVEYFRVGRPYADADERLMNSWLSGWAIPDLATGEEFVGWTRDAGFSDVQLDDIGRRVDPSLRRLSRMTRLLYPAAAALHALGIRSSVQHGNVRGARDQYRARRRGLWFEGLLTATASAEHRL